MAFGAFDYKKFYIVPDILTKTIIQLYNWYNCQNPFICQDSSQEVVSTDSNQETSLWNSVSAETKAMIYIHHFLTPSLYHFSLRCVIVTTKLM